MKLKTKIFLVFSILALPLLACNLCDILPDFLLREFDCPQPINAETTISAYPVSFKGQAGVTIPGEAGSCSASGPAQFTANADGTCALYVSFEDVYPDYQGNCISGGYTKGWLVTGTFDKATQVCTLRSCNDNDEYAASGSVTFTAGATQAATVKCRLAENDKTQVTINLPIMFP